MPCRSSKDVTTLEPGRANPESGFRIPLPPGGRSNRAEKKVAFFVATDLQPAPMPTPRSPSPKKKHLRWLERETVRFNLDHMQPTRPSYLKKAAKGRSPNTRRKLRARKSRSPTRPRSPPRARLP